MGSHNSASPNNKREVTLQKGKNTIFEAFVVCNSQWGSQSWIFFRDHPSISKDVYIERHHKIPNLSYLDAPIILHHYLAVMHLGYNIGSIDIFKYLETTNFRGSSLAFLKKIINIKETISPRWEEVPHYLNEYGPGLISFFEVEQSFLEGKYSYLIQRTKTSYIGTHSMVLIGYRYTKSKEVMYLLQSCWTHNMFIEVNIPYLKECNAKVTFCKEIYSFPLLDMNLHPYVETETYGQDLKIYNY